MFSDSQQRPKFKRFNNVKSHRTNVPSTKPSIRPGAVVPLSAAPRTSRFTGLSSILFAVATGPQPGSRAHARVPPSPSKIGKKPGITRQPGALRPRSATINNGDHVCDPLSTHVCVCKSAAHTSCRAFRPQESAVVLCPRCNENIEKARDRSHREISAARG